MYQIKNTDIEINVDQPFANCKLGRLKYACVLEKIISTNHQGGVISLNGKWGTGKTTFVRMFAQMLKNKGYPTILFNAWETDFISDPLIALIGELEAVNKQSIRALEAVKDAAAKISKGIAPALAKDLIKKCIGENTSNHLINTIENEVRTFKAELERYNEEKSSITEFRRYLARYLDEITSDNPLVFIIDELDRCNPHYAVKVLERVKHLFSISNIVFILSIDKEQLCNPIKGYYGSDSLDSNEYLRRFIDVEYHLPSPNYKDYIEFELSRLDFASFFSRSRQFENWEDSFERLVTGISDHSRMTLRQIQKMLVQLRLSYSTLNIENEMSANLLTPIFLLLYFRTFAPELYESIKARSLTLEELVNQIENALPTSYFSNSINDEYSTYTLTFAFVALLNFYIDQGYLGVSYPLLKEKVHRESEDELTFEVSKFNSKTVLKAVLHYRNVPRYSGLEYLINHIELYQEILEG